MSGSLMSAMGLGDAAADGGGERAGDLDHADESGRAQGRAAAGETASGPTTAPGRATLEEIYRRFRTYRSLLVSATRVSGGRGAPPSFGASKASAMVGEELEEMLATAGYASISDFERFISDFEGSFEREAARSTRELLDRYAALLRKEAARYRDPSELSSLHGKLGGLRKQHAVFEENAQLANDHVANAERARMPGNGHLRPTGNPLEARAAHQRAMAAKASAEREVHGLAAAHPIFQEEGVPLDRRLDKAALAEADEGSLGGLLQGHIASRLSDFAEAKALLQAKPELVYKLDKLFPRLLAEQSIAPGSVFAMILEDKLRDDAIVRLTAGVLVAAVSISLVAVSLGAATPAVAAGAAVLGFGVSAATTYQEIEEHGEQKELADVGFAEDPSVAWLAVAVLGAALDLGAAARAMKALGPAAQAVARGGDPAELTKLIRAYEKAGQLDAKIARSVERAAEARQGFFEAASDLRAALLGKAFAFPGPLTDPDVFRHLVRLAKEGIGVAFHTFSEYVTHLRLKYELSDLSSEELVKARDAWEQAGKVRASAEVPLDIRDGDALIGRFSYGSHLEIIPRLNREEMLHGGNTIKLEPNRTTTITGTLGDTNAVAERGFLAPGTTLMGENLGGINLLRSPQWRAIQNKHKAIKDRNLYWKSVTDEFWETVNKPWLDEAIARNDQFRFVSDPHAIDAVFVTHMGQPVLDKNGARIQSIFGREVDYLKSHGYTFQPDGSATRGR